MKIFLRSKISSKVSPHLGLIIGVFTLMLSASLLTTYFFVPEATVLAIAALNFFVSIVLFIDYARSQNQRVEECRALAIVPQNSSPINDKFHQAQYFLDQHSIVENEKSFSQKRVSPKNESRRLKGSTTFEDAGMNSQPFEKNHVSDEALKTVLARNYSKIPGMSDLQNFEKMLGTLPPTIGKRLVIADFECKKKDEITLSRVFAGESSLDTILCNEIYSKTDLIPHSCLSSESDFEKIEDFIDNMRSSYQQIVLFMSQEKNQSILDLDKTGPSSSTEVLF